MRALASALVLLAALTGCSAASEAPSAASSSQQVVVEQPRPTGIQVPARQIEGSVMLDGLGLDANGGHAEPDVKTPELASWYNLGPRPGAVGPAVVLGHVNGGGKPGIFANLHNVRDGDLVIVSREDGSDIAFEVYRKLSIDKTEFPTQEVYGNTEGPELRLITCTGTFNSDKHSYESNLIVFARQVPGSG